MARGHAPVRPDQLQHERDPLTLDAEAWADYFASLKVDALLMGGGGIVAFYPTEVPYHHRSAFLGARDLFGDMAAAARRRGLPRGRAHGLQLHATRMRSGRGRNGSSGTATARRAPHGESTWLFKTRMFSPYFTEQMPAIYREMNWRYSARRLLHQRWPSTGELTV